MQQILLVEGSTMFGRVIKKRLEGAFDLPVFWVKTLRETLDLLKQPEGSFSMALLGMNLTDAPHGEVIREVAKRGISTIVLASNISAEVRELIWSEKIADYILKDDPNSVDYVVAAMARLFANEKRMILVVDSDDTDRTTIAELLYTQRYRVVTAKDGATALNILERQPEVRLLITAYDLPDMNGCTLCRKIREAKTFKNLAILGFSTLVVSEIGARLLKSGATDIITRESYLLEEFFARVHRCIESVDTVNQQTQI